MTPPFLSPGPRGLSLLPFLLEFKRDPLGTVVGLRRRYGDSVHFRVGRHSLYFFHHPDHIEHVFLDRGQKYTRTEVERALFRPILGDGVFTCEGTARDSSRQLLQSTLQQKRMESIVDITADLTRSMLESWQGPAKAGQPVNMAEEMMGLTFGILSRVLFGKGWDEEFKTLRKMFKTVSDYPYDRMTSLLKMPDWVPTPALRRFRRAFDFLDEFIFRHIAQCRSEGSSADTLLGALFQQRDAATGETMSDKMIRDQIMTLFNAGYSTTGTALTWVWYLLSLHPEAAENLRREAADTLNGHEPDIQGLQGLTYTRRVVQEGMRLYPPVWLTAREAAQDDEMEGCPIPAGSTVLVSPYSTHRHPFFWNNPETFDPDRFAPDHISARPRFAYFPFGGGPRQCLGTALAMTEALAIVAMVAQRYSPRLVPGRRVRPGPGWTMHPLEGMWMTLGAS